MNKFLPLLPIIVILAVLSFIYLYPTQKTDTIIQNSPRPSQSATLPSDSSANFQDPYNSYALSVPPGMTIVKEGEYSHRISQDVLPQGAGNPSFIYISIVPKGQENALGTIYNYNRSDFTKLVRSQPGSTIILGDSPNPDLNSYFTYTHAESRMLGGYSAKSFINNKPWEFPGGTTEFRYIIEMAHVQYIFGAYLISDTSSPSYISPTQFEQFLNSLNLTPDQIKLTNLPPVTNGERKTFTDRAAGITLAYPADWDTVPNGQTFEAGDLLTLRKSGQTQRPQTELYDGALFGVMKPLSAPANLKEWIQTKYSQASEAAAPDQKPEFSTYSANNISYEKVRVCGLGCFDYYHTIQNGKLYGFLVKAEGPQAEAYSEAMLQIINTVTYVI